MIRLVAPADGSTTQGLQAYSGPIDWTGEEHSAAAPVRFSWTGGHAPYQLELSVDPAFTNPMAFPGLNHPELDVHHLYVNMPYFWRVSCGHGRYAITSPPASFQTSPLLPRWISLPGFTNVRDVGGWQTADGRHIVRQGLLYRGSECSDTNGFGVRIMRQQLQIHTIIDLRSNIELTPVPLPEAHTLHAPILPYADMLTDDSGEQLRRIFAALADPRTYPAFLHCVHGADRTATVVLLLGAILGLRTEDLTLDYELTSLSLSGRRCRTMAEFVQLVDMVGLSPGGGDTSGAIQLLRSLGVSMGEIKQIRQIFLA